LNLAALKKALFSLFGERGIPSEKDLKDVAIRIFREVCEAVDDEEDDNISKADLYNYLVKRSEVGISLKSVDKLFSKLDISGDGSINEEEFVKVIDKLCNMLRKDEALEAKLVKAIPSNHVVPGSCRMNARSGTTAFGARVVRRKSMRRLFEVFNDVNLDGDGSISLMEFRKHMAITRPELQPMAASIFNSIDNRRTGKVSFKRLLERMYPDASSKDIKTLLIMARPRDYLPKTKPDQELMDEVEEIFQIYDDDHSGTLDEEEFVFAMSETARYSEEDAKKMFVEIDVDGSGEVSFEEFQVWFVSNEQKKAQLLRDTNRDSDDEM